MLCGQPELIQYAKEIPDALTQLNNELNLNAPMPEGGLSKEEQAIIIMYNELEDLYEHYQENFTSRYCTQTQILFWYNLCKYFFENNIVEKVSMGDYEDIDFELILGEEY